ncbi:MAG: GAF and ANTAR domain-containing protein [Mycobacteriaceae bacterium]|nr:GAF and ANTAR domain-containing protein [Mycobacteriaceae bacterium]
MNQADDQTQEIAQEMEFLGYDRILTPVGRSCIELFRDTAELAREVQSETKPHYEPVVEQFAGLAAVHIDYVVAAGALMLLGKGGWRPVSPPGTTACVIEELHRDGGEGPAIEAADTRRVVQVTDLAAETRWPQFTDAARSETAVRSMICLPLYTHVRTWGALTLLGDQPNALDRDVQQAGEILATHTALTLEAVHHDRHYRSALGSRDIIGQAKGVLMERFEVDAVAAFALLTRLSEESHRPVVVVAKELLENKLSAKP